MSEQNSPQPEDSSATAAAVQRWFVEKPMQAAIGYLLTTTLLAGSAGFVGTRAAGAQTDKQPSINAEQFATKQDKEELWRYLNQRGQMRDGQFTDLRSIVATKDEVRGLREIVELQSRKSDEQIRMLQDQNKLMQELIQMSRR